VKVLLLDVRVALDDLSHLVVEGHLGFVGLRTFLHRVMERQCAGGYGGVGTHLHGQSCRHRAQRLLRGWGQFAVARKQCRLLCGEHRPRHTVTNGQPIQIDTLDGPELDQR